MEPVKLRIFQDPTMFGYQVQLYVGGRGTAKISVVTDMTFEDVTPGQVIPEKAAMPIDEDSLRELGQYLIGQGLIVAPVTEQERKDHEALKIKFEMQEKLLEQMRENLKDSNARLDQIAGVMEMVKTYQEREGK